MTRYLSDSDLDGLVPAEIGGSETPIPTRTVSNGEFTPWPQTTAQKAVEARLLALADDIAPSQGMNRRRFLASACGMAAGFVAMNETFGPLFDVTTAEAREPDVAAERAAGLANQFIFDDQVHFLRDDTKLDRMLGIRRMANALLNPDLGEPDSIDLLKFENFLKEVYVDSDTTVALLSAAPSDRDDFRYWHLSNDDIAAARTRINGVAGSRRLFAHSIFTPGRPGWMEEIDRAHETLKPDSWKGYTTGDPSGPSQYMWRMDDEALVYPAYEKMLKAGVTTICVHKGLLPDNAEETMPGVVAHSNVDDLGKAAADWPELTFVIYHAAFRPGCPQPSAARLAEFEQTGQMQWVSDLAAIPAQFGVDNVYADLGACFALTCTTQPRYCAGMLATLIKGLGADHVMWGTDSVWFGSPQWQIEAFRRIEVPEDMQQKLGFAPLGPADGPVKTAILGGNAAKLYGLGMEETRAPRPDGIERIRAAARDEGWERSNRAYGWVAPA